MSDFASNDIVGDVFGDRTNHIDDVVRTANRERIQRRMQDTAEAEEDSCGRDPPPKELFSAKQHSLSR